MEFGFLKAFQSIAAVLSAMVMDIPVRHSNQSHHLFLDYYKSTSSFQCWTFQTFLKVILFYDLFLDYFTKVT